MSISTLLLMIIFYCLNQWLTGGLLLFMIIVMRSLVGMFIPAILSSSTSYYERALLLNKTKVFKRLYCVFFNEVNDLSSKINNYIFNPVLNIERGYACLSF